MSHTEKKHDQYYEMANAPISHIIPKLAAPTIVSMLISSIYNMADTFFVSQLGTSASGAVGVIFSAMSIIQALAFMIGMGSGNYMTRSLGAGKRELAKQIVSIAFFTGIIMGLVITVSATFNIHRVVLLLGATETIAPYAEAYAHYIFIAAPFMICSFIMNNLLRFQGKASFAMVGITVGGLLNIALDPLFIFAFHLGVRGAALATILSQAVSCIWVLSFLCGKKTILHIRKKNLILKPEIILPCVALGLATFIMQASERIISVCFNSSLLKYGGDIAVGAMTILTSVMQFAMLPLQGLGQGAQPVLSYNYGAKNGDRVKKAFRLLLTASLCYSTLLWAFIMLFPQVFAEMFTSDSALLGFTKSALRIYCACLLLFGIQIACQMAFTSFGKAKASIAVAVTRKFILLLPLIYLLPHILTGDKTNAVYMAEPIADFLAVSFTTVLFTFQFRKVLKELEG